MKMASPSLAIIPTEGLLIRLRVGLKAVRMEAMVVVSLN